MEKKSSQSRKTKHQSLDTIQFRLVLTEATATVLRHGLSLLGIPVLERM
jgi:arginyl-tRNA synthetase